MSKKQGTSKLARFVFRVTRWLVQLFYPRISVEGAENLPDEGCLVVGNHTQMNGPICGELYFPGKRKIWCAWQMMYLKEVPDYAFEDFWGDKPAYIRWFFRLMSYIIAPLSVCVFNNALTIPVYHDGRLITTFKQTIASLENGERVIIFPECKERYSHIVYRFQDKFVDLAKLYYKRSGKVLSFVPMYIAPKLRKMYIGKPIAFNPEAPVEQERERICEYLMREITDIASALPRHKVVPYANIPKKNYGYNIPCEVTNE